MEYMSGDWDANSWRPIKGSPAIKDGAWTPPSLLHTMTHKRRWAPLGYGAQ